ncbi:MAG TPA: GNAT family N-acetyltransferase, partial [Chitinophagaceae bacterium]
MEIIKMLTHHWEDVKRIYEEGIATGDATFQTAAPAWEEWNGSHLEVCRLISVENDKLSGWIALTPLSGRCVYSGVAEVSIYVAQNAKGKGIGKQLLRSVINESEHHN